MLFFWISFLFSSSILVGVCVSTDRTGVFFFPGVFFDFGVCLVSEEIELLNKIVYCKLYSIINSNI